MENLAHLETLCERLYQTQDSAERAFVENTLRCFSKDTNNIPQLQYLLENAGNPYAVLFASSSLLKHVTEKSLPLLLGIDIRNRTITYLAARGAELENIIMSSLIILLCRVTKFSWFDDDTFEEVVKDTMNFFNQEAKHYAVGLKILNQLVIEMSQKNPELSLMEHRKVTTVFKDKSVLQIFEISLSSLHRLKTDAQPKLQELALSLSLLCLSFDFAGMAPDETSDDASSIQLPGQWKSVIEEPSTINIFFEYYAATVLPLTKLGFDQGLILGNSVQTRICYLKHRPVSVCEMTFIFPVRIFDNPVEDAHILLINLLQMEGSSNTSDITSWNLMFKCLECLVMLASIRRSLFTSNTTRMQFFSALLMGTKDIMEKGRGLNDHDNYHGFCRLLGSFKVQCRVRCLAGWFSNLTANQSCSSLLLSTSCNTKKIFQRHFRMSEMMSMEGYNAWICLLSDSALHSLKSWKWAGGSVHYLLGLWSRMVQSLPYLKGEFPGIVRVEELVPKILKGFISSRFDLLQTGHSDELAEDPLDKIELVQEQLDFFPHLCKVQYESMSTYLVNIMNNVLKTYMDVAQLDHITSSHLEVTETKLSWMLHIIASILRMKDWPGGQPNEIIDAELSARALRLINAMDSGLHVQRYGELSRQRLELAVLSFFRSFRNTCIGDQTMPSCKQLYLRLSELLGLHDRLLVLDVMVRKIASNLKCFSESEEVMEQTLSFFLEMASGYMTSKQLVKLESFQYITANHNRQFRFLEDYRSRKRTTFYYTIGLLVFMEDSIVKFRQSMDPLLQVIVNLESATDPIFQSETVKFALVGLMRDLRGIAMATNSRRTYGFLFEWLYPAHTPLLLRAITTWADDPEVMNPLLKFIAELVLNKAQRLNFDQSSVNGILLFREVSKILVAYGSRVLNTFSQSDMYTRKYKGMWVSLVVLSRVIDGNYVNFGVFELYGDRALADALDVALKMILSIPSEHMLAYRKVANAYFSFMEIILGKYIRFALDLDASTLEYIFRSLLCGLKCLDQNLVIKSVAAINHLATFYFDNVLMEESPRTTSINNFAMQIANCGDVLHEILKTLFEIVLFEDTSNHWNIGKPMLSLILLSEEMYEKLKAEIVSSQPVDKQQHTLQGFHILMEGITRSVDPRNREKFATNLRKFKKEFRGK